MKKTILYVALILLAEISAVRVLAEDSAFNENNTANVSQNYDISNAPNVPITNNRGASSEAPAYNNLSVVNNDIRDQPNVLINKEYDNKAIIQVGFAPNIPEATRYSKVSGLKLGLPMSSGEGRVDGLEFSLLASGTENISGVQLGLLLNNCHNLDGVQLGFISIANISSYGLQLSVVNGNAGKTDGLQLGIANVVTGKLDGVQIGTVNYAESANAPQIGVINISNKGGFQIGLINYISDGIVPVLPLVNFSL